jgi:hypothetical protein
MQNSVRTHRGTNEDLRDMDRRRGSARDGCSSDKKAIADIADRRRMFDLFTLLEVNPGQKDVLRIYGPTRFCWTDVTSDESASSRLLALPPVELGTRTPPGPAGTWGPDRTSGGAQFPGGSDSDSD